MCDRFHWARLLAFVTGLVNQELLLRNEYLIAENRILRSKLPNRLRLSDPDRAVLGEIAKRLGRRALRDIARVARPDTILGWYRRLIAQKFDGSRHRSHPGRPRISRELETLVVRFARENRSWGYDRIAGALANLGHAVSDQTLAPWLLKSGRSLPGLRRICQYRMWPCLSCCTSYPTGVHAPSRSHDGFTTRKVIFL
jgi:hypothetical protein